jgi:hypothetical protein
MQLQKKKVKSIHTYYENRPSYAEMLKRVQSSYDQIKPSMPDEDSKIRNKVSSTIEIPVEIVDEFLCFSEYLSKQVLKTLAESKVDKYFFDRAQRVKRQLIKVYRHDKLSEEKITSKISKAVFEMYREYIEKGKIKTKDWQRFLENGNKIKNGQRSHRQSKHSKRKSKKFKYWPGDKEFSEPKPTTLYEINKALENVQRGLGEIDLFGPSDLNNHANNIRKEILRLAKVYQQILKFDHSKGCDQYEEAA